jgi:hypothetical protein
MVTKRPFGAVFATKYHSAVTRSNPPFSFSNRFALWQICGKFIFEHCLLRKITAFRIGYNLPDLSCLLVSHAIAFYPIHNNLYLARQINL